MLWAPQDWIVKPTFLVQQWNGRHGLNPEWWKLVSGSYRAILGKRTRKFYNTSLFYKVPLDHLENFLAPKNKPSVKNLNYLQMHMSNSLVPISTKPVHVLFEHLWMYQAKMLADLRAGCSSAFWYKVKEDEHLPLGKQQLFHKNRNSFSQGAFWLIGGNLRSARLPVFYQTICIHCNL